MSYSYGAQIACSFGTILEGLERIGICSNDVDLINGLGPFELASAMLCKALGAQKIFGIEDDKRLGHCNAVQDVVNKN